MNKLLNNLLGMYKQAKLNKKAEEVVYDSDLIAQVLSMTKNQKEDEFSIVTLSPEKDKVLGVKYIKKDEVYDYKPNQNEYALVMTRDTGFADTDYQLQPMSMVVRSWNEGRKFYATKKNRLNKKAEEDLIEVGWGLYTNDEYEIKDNALYGDDKPQEVNETFWNKINNEIDKVESWFLKEGYKKFFTKVRDEGHGKDSELGGTAWMTENQLKDFMANAEQWDTEFVLAESSGTLDFGNIPVDYNEALSFKLKIYVDDKDLDELGIESKRVSKNKKLSSKNTKLTKKAGWKVLTPKDLTEEVKDEFLKDSIKEYAGHVKREDFYFVKGIKEKEDDQFSYEWEEGMFGEWGTNVKGEKWYSLTDLGDDWDYIYLIKEDKLYKMPKRESLTDFGVVSSKAKDMRKKAFRKLCLKRAFHKTAGEFEEMMKLKSTDPKLISYLAKEFGVEESTVSQYTDVSENAEELYNILEEQANKYGYEWDKFEYDEYGDRIDEDDFRGDPDDLEKAVEYLKNNIDKTMFKFEYVGKYEDNYLTFSVVSEKLIPTERPVIYITHNTKNYDISLFVQTKESKEQDKAEGIESDNSLTILIRRTSDEILNEIVNYVNVELPKKIEEQNKKQSSKAELVRKQADEKSERVKKDIEKVVSEMDKSLKVVFRDYGDGYKIGKKEIEDFIKGTGTQVKVLDSGEYILVSPSGKEQTLFNDDTLYIKDNDVYIKQPGMFPKKLAFSTKKQAGIDPNVSAEDILKLNFDMPIEKADKVKEQFNEKGIKYQSRKGKYTVEFSVDIEAGKVDLVYEIIRNIKKASSTKKQAEKVLTLKEAIGKDESEFKNMEDIVDYMNHLPLNANKSSWTVEGFGGNSIDVENLSNGEKATIKLKKNFNSRYATRQNKLFKSATIKHENGVYNVYSESGKCLGKGYKTKEEAEKRLKQVEYFKNKKAKWAEEQGTDFYGPVFLPNEDKGIFRIKYYGGPGKIEYLRKAKNGKYHWVDQTQFDYQDDKPFETTDYELVKKLVDQFGGKPEKVGTKQVNNNKKSLKDIVISKMAENKK